MRVLLSGGAGYVGSVAARVLLAEGHHVRVLDSLLYGGQALLGLYHYENFDFVRGDIRSADVANAALAEVDAVVHLAAIVGDPACARQPELACDVNLDASLRLIELTQRRGIKRFVFASTCSNYGRMADPLLYVTEDSELCPVSLYAETKVAVERALLDASIRDKSAVTVLRFATVFGVSPRMRFDLTVNEFTMEILTRRRLAVYGAHFWRPYIHVRDAARAIAMVLDAPIENVSGKVFNVGDTSQNYQKRQLVELICAQVGNDVEIDYIQKEEDPRDYRVSFDRIRDALGFEITRDVEDGIREIIGAIKQGVISDFDNPSYRN
ncbi:MAG: NAD-dependent epimerase/dehydratase family protein [Candidatus Zipacnadales bacterium]